MFGNNIALPSTLSVVTHCANFGVVILCACTLALIFSFSVEHPVQLHTQVTSCHQRPSQLAYCELKCLETTGVFHLSFTASGSSTSSRGTYCIAGKIPREKTFYGSIRPYCRENFCSMLPCTSPVAKGNLCMQAIYVQLDIIELR